VTSVVNLAKVLFQVETPLIVGFQGEVWEIVVIDDESCSCGK